MNTFLVTLLITQKSNSIDWVELVTRQGINQGETLTVFATNINDEVENEND
jgi:hypothetical protein